MKTAGVRSGSCLGWGLGFAAYPLPDLFNSGLGEYFIVNSFNGSEPI